MHSVGDTLKWGKGKLPDGHQPPVCLVRVSTPIASQGTPIHQMNMVYYKVQDNQKRARATVASVWRFWMLLRCIVSTQKQWPKYRQNAATRDWPYDNQNKGHHLFLFLKECELFLWFSGAKHFVSRELSFQCSLMRYDLSQEHQPKWGQKY